MKTFGTFVLCLNSGGSWLGYRRGARSAGKDGEKHHLHSDLYPSFVAKKRVGGQ